MASNKYTIELDFRVSTHTSQHTIKTLKKSIIHETSNREKQYRIFDKMSLQRIGKFFARTCHNTLLLIIKPIKIF